MRALHRRAKELFRRRHAPEGTLREEELVSGLLDLAEGLAGNSEFSDQMQLLCRSASQLLHCDRCSVFLREADRYRAKFNHGNPPDIAAVFHEHTVRLDDPLISRAIETRSFVIVNDAQRDALMHHGTARRARIRAIVVAPLFRNQTPVGFLTAEYNENPGSFSALGSKLLLGLGKLAELSIRNHEATQNAKQLEERLRSGERLEALTRMAGGVAHDFNNCLTVILGVAEFLRGQDGLPGAGDAIQDLQSSAERAAGLTRRLLYFSRGLVVEEQGVNVAAALRALEGELRRLIPPDMSVSTRISSSDSFASCSPTEISQIVTNLVLNAANASLPGSEVRVLLDEMGVEASSRLDEQDLKPGNYIVLTVADTGHGIAPEDIPHLFEPFFSTSTPGAGTGLGLSTVFGIVTAAGGQIRVDSSVGSGTEVRVYLPAVEEIVSSDPVDHSDQRRDPIGSPTILVVDDDEIVRRMVAAILRGWGTTTVIEAASADQARERAAAHRGDIHLLVTDVVMPDGGGQDLARSLMSERPTLEVLFISGYSPEAMMKRGVSQDIEHFLAKPFGREELIRKVSGVLGGALQS